MNFPHVHLQAKHINILISNKWLNLTLSSPIYNGANDKLLNTNVKVCMKVSLKQEYNVHSTLQDKFADQEEEVSRVVNVKGHKIEKELLYALRWLKYIYEKRITIFEDESDKAQHYQYPKTAQHSIEALKIQEQNRMYFQFLKQKLSRDHEMIYGSTYIVELQDNLTIQQRLACCEKIIEIIQKCVTDMESSKK